MANVSVSNITLSAIVSVTVSVASYSYSSSYQDITYSTDGASVSYTYELIETRPLPAENLFISETDVKTVGLNPDDDITMSDSDLEKDINLNPSDSVTVNEGIFKAVTNPIDFDPTDDDVDPTPVTMSDSDAKEVTVGELADNDETSVTESSAKTATKPGITASVSTSEAIDDFNIGKNVADTATASEAIDQFDVTTQFSDTVSITEAAAKTITPDGKTDSVTMSGDNIKAINSSVDFDPSDDDVDADPINIAEQINTIGVNKGLTDSPSITETTSKNFTRPDVADTATALDSPALNPEIPKTDSVTAVEGIKNNPSLVKTESVTSSESITKFDVRPSFTDSISTPTEAIDEFDVGKALTDSVTVTEVNVKTFTENVDFDRSDADADADPVSVTESAVFSPTHPLSDAFSPSETINTFAITVAYSDTATASESINLNLILGESSYLYPDFAYMNDGNESPSLRGYHKGIGDDYAERLVDTGYLMNEDYAGMLNEGLLGGVGGDAVRWYALEFVQSAFRFRNVDYDAQVNGLHTEMNYTFMHGSALDDIKQLPYTGVIGAAERINNAVINADTITYGELTNAGLIVNFMYTDTEDRTCGGHFINETPLCAGAYV